MTRTIRLITCSICCTTGALWVATAQGQTRATVSVDARRAMADFSPLGLGVHTSPYYNSLTHQDADDRLEEAGVTTLRYGGGGYADVLHWSIARPQWESGVTGGGLSPWFGQPGNFGYVGPGSDFGSFVGLLDRTENSRAVVTVNYGSALKLENGQSVVPDFGGQPQEAAAWVAYANADPAIYGTAADVTLGVDQQGNDWKTAGYWARLRASTGSQYQAWASADGVYEPLNRFLAIDRDAPVGIEHWEIGNETFGTGYYGGGNGYSVDYDLPYDGTSRKDNPALSPARYGQDLVQYAQLMRAVDPSIKIGAVLATPPDDYNWAYADLNDNGHKGGGEPYWNDEVLSNAAQEIDFVVVHWYPHVGENADGAGLLAEVAAKIPRMIDGATAGQDSGADAGVRDSLAAHGIPDAQIMVTEFNYFGSLASGVENPAEAIFVADAYASWLERGVTSVQYLEMLTKDFLSDASGLTPGSAYYGVSVVDKLAQPGGAFVEASSSAPSVRAHAAWRADGGLAVMLLNTSLSSEAEVTLALDGVRLDGEGTLYTLTGGNVLAAEPLVGLGDAVTATLAPRTVQVLVMSASLLLAGDFNGDGLVDAADYTVWRDEAGTSGVGLAADANRDDVVDHADYEVWRAAFGASPPPPATSAPSPAASTIAVFMAIVGRAALDPRGVATPLPVPTHSLTPCGRPGRIR